MSEGLYGALIGALAIFMGQWLRTWLTRRYDVQSAALLLDFFAESMQRYVSYRPDKFEYLSFEMMRNDVRIIANVPPLREQFYVVQNRLLQWKAGRAQTTEEISNVTSDMQRARQVIADYLQQQRWLNWILRRN